MAGTIWLTDGGRQFHVGMHDTELIARLRTEGFVEFVPDAGDSDELPSSPDGVWSVPVDWEALNAEPSEPAEVEVVTDAKPSEPAGADDEGPKPDRRAGRE